MDALANLIIRPPRARYDPNRALPGPALRINQRTYLRTDIQARRHASLLRFARRAFSREHARRGIADAARSRAAQLRNAEGHALECSHYTPDVWSQPVRVRRAPRPLLRGKRRRTLGGTRPRRGAGGRYARRAAATCGCD